MSEFVVRYVGEIGGGWGCTYLLFKTFCGYGWVVCACAKKPSEAYVGGGGGLRL